MGYKVKIKSFEGPFDLLVYLIESARMDIYDIKVSEITEQYLQYISDMQKMEVQVASEFMVLAANLIEIKSKMLLPRMNTQGEVVEAEDPRTDLVERLLEYKRFKKASEILAGKEEEGMRIIAKPQEDISKFQEEPEEILHLEAAHFMKAFEVFLGKKKKVSEIRKNYENVQKKKITSEARVEFIKQLFEADPNKKYTFSKTVSDVKDRYDIALSFTSVLEMAKQRQINAEQERLFGEIFISKGDRYHAEKSIEEEERDAQQDN